MNECISRDDLASLTSAIEGPLLPVTDHLATCNRCREEAAAIEELRGLLAAEAELPAGFVDGVMQRVVDPLGRPALGTAPGPARGMAGTRLGRAMAAVGAALLAGAAVLVVLWTGPDLTGSGVGVGAGWVYGLASLVAAALGLRELGEPPPEPVDSRAA